MIGYLYGMNWLDGVLIAVLVLGAILGFRHKNFIGRLSHFLAVFTVLVFTAAILWVVISIVTRIPFLGFAVGFIIGIGGPIVISIIIAIMFYLTLVKLYRNAAVYEKIQSAIIWNPPVLLNRLGTGLATSAIIAVILSMLIVVVTLFAIGGIYWSTSYSDGVNWNTLTAVFGSALCRCSLSIFGWLSNWTGLMISTVLVIAYLFLLRRGQSVIKIEPSISFAGSKSTPSIVRQYYEEKLKSTPEVPTSPDISLTAILSTEATMVEPVPIPPLPPLPRTSDASAAQECFGRACDLETAGKHEKAIEEYTKAIRLDARHTLAYLKRGLLLKNMGMKPAAIADFRRVLDTSDNPDLIEKAKDHIAELG